MFLASRPTYIIHRLEDTGVDITVVLCGWFPADIRRGRDNRFLETIAEFLGEGLVGYSYPDAPILGDKVLCQIHRSIEYHGQGFLSHLGTVLSQLKLFCRDFSRERTVPEWLTNGSRRGFFGDYPSALPRNGSNTSSRAFPELIHRNPFSYRQRYLRESLPCGSSAPAHST